MTISGVGNCLIWCYESRRVLRQGWGGEEVYPVVDTLLTYGHCTKCLDRDFSAEVIALYGVMNQEWHGDK